jgi:predicted esterase
MPASSAMNEPSPGDVAALEQRPYEQAMVAQLLALHGYTMNGAGLAESARRLTDALASRVQLIFLDAPHTCSAQSVVDFYAPFPLRRPDPPHLTWWRASEDGEVYEGWERSVEVARAAADGLGPIGVLGFSQGAMLTSVLAALATRGEFPALRFAVLIAGGPPRARELAPLLEAPIRIPSLHVWGERDAVCSSRSPELAQRFEARTRHSLVWPGSHTFPAHGFPMRVIEDFVAAQLDE